MFKKYLNPDSRIYHFFETAWNLILVNLLTLLCSIPIITVGASLSAMYDVLLRIRRKEEGVIHRGFFASFRRNFVQATILWVMFALVFLSFAVDYRFTVLYPETFPVPVRYVVITAAFLVFMVFLYVFPLQSHFENSIFMTIRNAAILSFSKIFRTIPMALVWVIPWAILNFSFPLMPLVLMLGISLPAYVGVCLYDKTFRLLEENQSAAEMETKMETENE